MGRPVMLSNGSLMVGLDENGLVHDFYYPYVGLDNLTNARSSQHKLAVWADGQFSWTDDGTWQVTVDFLPEALISRVTMKSQNLGVTLIFNDFVDNVRDVFIRRLKVTNDKDSERDIRVFFHQVFQISRAGRADTAMFVPDGRYILDYKGRCCLLIAGKFTDGVDFDQYAIGNYRIEGKAGTFMDAEDGELSNNPIEHGGVDSVLRFQRQLSPDGNIDIDYWIIAGSSQNEIQAIHEHLKDGSVEARLTLTAKYFENWMKPSIAKLQGLPENHRTAVQKSLLVIKAHCDARGSILASGDSSIFNYGRDYYCYCWPRDAAYAIWPLIRLGLYEEAKKFFIFAHDTMHPDGYLMHKYQPDRAIGSTWHPLLHGRNRELAIQEDETAITLFMLGEYYEASKDEALIIELYESFILPCVKFITKFIDSATGLPHASYDLWEQKFMTSTYTVSTVIKALSAATQMASVAGHEEDSLPWQKTLEQIKTALDALYHPDGYFRKGFLLQDNGNLAYDDAIDISSLYGPFMFAQLPLNDPRLNDTASTVERRLFNTSPIGGVIRYEHDDYFLAKQQYKGNPWIVCTMWLAQYYISSGRKDEGAQLIEWALSRVQPSGVLSEQFDPEDGHSLSVTPLVWSHAELINTILDYADLD